LAAGSILGPNKAYEINKKNLPLGPKMGPYWVHSCCVNQQSKTKQTYKVARFV